MQQQQSQLSQQLEQDGEPDWSQVTPYDVIRMQNCKTSKFYNKEIYPSIRPPISKCTNAQTKVWLADAVEESGCGRAFGTEQDDDLLDAWKQTPNKHTLSFYGVGSNIERPEAIHFNQAITKCLDKVNGLEPELKKSNLIAKSRISRKKRTKPKGAFVLNRKVLQLKINKMPTVKRKMNASNALSWLYCPDAEDPEYPFLNDDQSFPLQFALDMELPAPRPKHGLRRKHKYCELQCGIAENMCTDLEWRKYNEDPLPYDVAFEMELQEMEGKCVCEPRNYDELYSHLLSCFEKNSDQIPMCTDYSKCCRRPSERRVIQGCGEQELYGPFGEECKCR